MVFFAEFDKAKSLASCGESTQSQNYAPIINIEITENYDDLRWGLEWLLRTISTVERATPVTRAGGTSAPGWTSEYS